MTRACHTPDLQRGGEAFARPGMDTRIWASLAHVTKIKVDPNGGVLADVKLLPCGTAETARVGSSMASQGSGLYLPIEVDDDVLVVAPDGCPDAGLVIVAAMWDRATKPPATAAQYPHDVLLQPPDGRTVRVVTTGGGLVLLGSATASEAAVLGSTYRRGEAGANGALETALTALAALCTALALEAAISPATQTLATTAATAATAAQAQLSTFEAAASTYLSAIVKVAP
jgi:hypothetical protein